jgi:hypothetical protein
MEREKSWRQYIRNQRNDPRNNQDTALRINLTKGEKREKTTTEETACRISMNTGERPQNERDDRRKAEEK